ncbi:hypothetical protein HOLleu_04719 [Holothuria leucospilota]|uniref:Uncharacterized protein n=1 Tax=Holothuria leucospilota TaxID=206669 RepID=A0A9Q1CIZ3_HOLLE|nr:hypothetical protein HOLleu_04719 [Holothuria leucospilota]
MFTLSIPFKKQDSTVQMGQIKLVLKKGSLTKTLDGVSLPPKKEQRESFCWNMQEK